MTTSQHSGDAAQAMEAHLELIGHDMQRWLDLFADDAVVEFPYAPSVGRPSRLDGKAAIDRHFRGTPGIFRDLRFRDRQHFASADPDVAIAEVHGSAVIEPTGRRYEQDYVMVLRTKAGKIVAYREYWNPLPVIEAFGGIDALPGLPLESGRAS